MAVGTALSRITGVGRIVVLTFVLGTAASADAYNLANTTPNIIHDIVIGGVLAATFVPVFVDRLSTRSSEDAWRAISAVTTATVAILAAATVAFWFLTPAIIHLYTASNHNPDRAQQQQVAIGLLRWFVPQLACYGLIALATALLNTRRKFATPMFVPIANNVVVIVALVWFHALVPVVSLAAIQHRQHALVLLGFGTTLGVVVQALLLVPSLIRARLHLHLRWEPGHEAMRTIVHLASWTFAFVVSSQIALVVILSLADGVKPQGAVTAYTYAYTFFQLPFGVVAVSVMSAVTPSLSAHWARGNTEAFRRRLAYGMRAMLAVIIPSAVGMLILSRPMIDAVLAHGRTTPADTSATAAALAMFSLGLPGFCIYLYLVRALQSMQDTRTVFFLYLVENTINIVTGLLLVGPLGVRGLALSLSISYTVAAILAIRVIGRRTGGIGADALRRPLRRVVLSSMVMGVVAVLAVSVSSADHGDALYGRVLLAMVAGGIAYLVTAVVLGARDRRLAHRWRRSPGPTPPSRPPIPTWPNGAVTIAGGQRSATIADPRIESTPANPFHDRLDAELTRSPIRHLRPVVSGSDSEEEDVHGPDQGGNR
jgi:putative peptidoglycan lipid II flippase